MVQYDWLYQDQIGIGKPFLSFFSHNIEQMSMMFIPYISETSIRQTHLAFGKRMVNIESGQANMSSRYIEPEISLDHH